MKALRVGLVGFGFAGRVFHAPAIAAVEGLELAAIVRRSNASAAEAFPQVNVVPSVEALLADSSIQLVVVATPNTTHVPIARQCLLAGRDVVVDKPFAVTSKDAAELIHLARKQQRLLSVFQNRRWDGDFLTVRKLLAGGQLSRLVRFESRYDRYRLLPRLHAWRENGELGGGVLIDLGAHLIDQVLVLFGLPQSIWASVRKEREGARSDDAFDIYLQYPQAPAGQSGLGVWLRATCLARSAGARFTLNGTRGTFFKYGMDPQEARLLAGDLYASKPWGLDPPDRWGTLVVDEAGEPVTTRVPTEAGDYRGYYSNVRDALQGTAPLEVTPTQGWQTTRVLEMALESSQAGDTVICDWTRQP